jgi:16S rRNA (cytidine1402-2'-O)-methyltransferase
MKSTKIDDNEIAETSKTPKQETAGGVLSVVATPIGNLEDITLRALRILKEADLVLCEDTRVTKKLLSHFDIHVQTESFHAHSALTRIDTIIERLREGQKLALVTDAGTPAISDPGALLVEKIRQELADEIAEGSVRIDAIPGASALTAALSIAGAPAFGDFTFLGFLPHKKGRETLFKEIAVSERPVVFYESPHRILKSLESLEKHFAESAVNSNRKVHIFRELTKIYEQALRGTPKEILTFFEENPDKVRGEFVVITDSCVQ